MKKLCHARKQKTLAALVGAAVLLGACGTRVEPAPGDSSQAPAAGASTIPDSTAAAAQPATPGVAGAPAAGPTDSTAASQSRAVPGRAGRGGGTFSGGATSSAAAGSSGQKNNAPTKATLDPGRPGASPTAPLPPQPNAQAGQRSPVILASVGTLSGPVGATVLPQIQGIQLWVQYINAQGGLNGHQVKLTTYDDGGDPARHFAQVKDAVERLKVIAFLHNAEPLTGRSSIEYLNQKRIPVVGMTSGEAWAYSSPMHFPQASSGEAVVEGEIASAASQLVPKGVKKLGTIVCYEVADSCGMADRVYGENAAKLGFDHVYRGKASLAQPDFTAECLAARNAGAEVLVMTMDVNSVSRIAASCARQNYKPYYGIMSVMMAEAQKKDPNLAKTVAASNVFPYMQTNTPATAEYQRAMATFGKGLAPGIGPAAGWVSGMLLKRATRQLPEPPTNEAVLRGLWSIKNDTLDGLTGPLTFTEGQPATKKTCWFDMSIINGAWASSDQFQLRCLS